MTEGGQAPSSQTSTGAIALWCAAGAGVLVIIASIVTGESYFQHVIDNMLPAVGFLVLGLVALMVLNDKKGPWFDAARSMVESACWALALLSLLLLVFNTWVMPRDNADDVIRNVEVLMIRTSHGLKKWTTLSTALAVAILLALMLVSRYRPDLKVVSRFAAGRKHIGRVTSAMVMATSFSFFTGEAIATDAGPRATQHASIVWRGAKEREHQAVARYLAARSLEQAVAADPAKATQHFAGVARAVSEMPALTDAQRDRLLDYSAWKDATGADQFDVRWEVESIPVDAAEPAELLDNPRHVIDAEVHSADVSEARANAEVKRAVNEVLKLALTAATKPYIEHLSSFVEHFMEHHAVALDEMVTKYGEKVADGHVEKASEPLLERATTLVSERLSADAAPARAFAELKTADAERAARRPVRAAVEPPRRASEEEGRGNAHERVAEPIHAPPRPAPMRRGRF